MMKKLQNATVRNVAGFKGGAQDANKTLFSNSFIRDSVISTLKDGGEFANNLNNGKGERYSDISSEIAQSGTQTLEHPRLSSLDNASIG